MVGIIYFLCMIVRDLVESLLPGCMGINKVLSMLICKAQFSKADQINELMFCNSFTGHDHNTATNCSIRPSVGKVLWIHWHSACYTWGVFLLSSLLRFLWSLDITLTTILCDKNLATPPSVAMKLPCINAMSLLKYLPVEWPSMWDSKASEWG